MITIRNAAPADVPQIMFFVKELAEFEREADKVVATEELLQQAMFGGDRPAAEAVMAEIDGKPVGIVKDVGRSCLIAASPEAKQKGVKTGCCLYDARALCPDIISMSAGCPTREQLPLLSFEVFWEQHLRQLKGTVLVAAAGND
ncbi:MAG: hypothetical protein V4808_09270, partial [Pseudomonadota bacterium]